MRLQLQECSYDLDKYDFIIFASPVWAFTIAPALRSFLKKIKNLEGKKAACFLTFGSGAGSRKALKELGGILNKKGAEVLFSRNLSDKKIRDESYLENNFKHLLEIVAS